MVRSDPQVFAERRQRLSATLAEGIAIIPAAHEAVRSNDTEYPFRQDSNFDYLTGFPEPDAIAVLRRDHDKPYVLFVRPKDREREIWTGFRAGPEGARERYGADEAYPISEWPRMLPELLAGGRPVYLPLGQDKRLDQTVIDTIDEMRKKSRLGIEAPTGVLDLRPILAEMRLIKTPDELALLEEAAAITAAGHLAAMREAAAGMAEYELQARIEFEFARRGAVAGYGTIVAGGANAAVLHYTENSRPLTEGSMVLIDAGAEYAGYTGDVTRTFPVGKRFEGAGRDVYAIVLAAHEAAVAAVRPGADLDAIHAAACRVIVRGLLDLGVLDGDADALQAEQAFKPYYMHRTSHWLGRDVHDVGAYVRDGKPRTLEPGMVFTIEPGLYFHADTAAHPSLHGIGVRIEDDVVVTDDGVHVLTDAVATGIDAIEQLRAEAP